MASLAPLGAYKLLGPAVSEIGGTIVGLEDIAGAEARRLSSPPSHWTANPQEPARPSA
jgi:hypothetical protein